MDDAENIPSRNLKLERSKLVLGKRDSFFGGCDPFDSEDTLETESLSKFSQTQMKKLSNALGRIADL
jgi:hypothetical protein